jgi:hypothetical protein
VYSRKVLRIATEFGWLFGIICGFVAKQACLNSAYYVKSYKLAPVDKNKKSDMFLRADISFLFTLTLQHMP